MAMSALKPTHLDRQTRQTMTTRDDTRSEYLSELVDSRQIPLVDVPTLSDNAVRRLVAPLAGQVPVATFNSAI